MTAYSFTDLRIKSMQIKGERPVIVILSGAGLSAESGIPTYRNADNNWKKPIYSTCNKFIKLAIQNSHAGFSYIIFSQ